MLGDFPRPGLLDHIVGVDHLKVEAEALDPARDQAPGSDRQAALNPAGGVAEPDQVDPAGLVLGPDSQGLLGASGTQVFRDGDPEGRHLLRADLHDGQIRALDQAMRGQEEKVPDQGPRYALQRRRNPGSHALQAGDRRKEGEQDLRPHGSFSGRRWPRRPSRTIPAPSHVYP